MSKCKRFLNSCPGLPALFLALPLALLGSSPVTAQPDAEPLPLILPELATFEALEPHLKLVNEFESRRRLNVWFENEPSIFDGAQVGYVNVGRGNLTFIRRDLVTVGRMPLMLARVYDSRLTDDHGFGPGWHLAPAEEILLDRDGSLTLLGESGARTRFRHRGDQFILDRPAPSDIASFTHPDPSTFVVRSKAGLIKEFIRSGLNSTAAEGRFSLSRVTDRNGNTISLAYEQGRLVRLVGSAGRELQITRSPSGQITAVNDDQGRTVDYRYDSRSRLSEVIDVAGNTWRYEYDPQDRLIRAIAPQSSTNLEAGFDASGRVVKLRIPSAEYSYSYSPGKTVVSNGAGRRSEYHQNAAGITTEVRNALAVTTQIELTKYNQVRRLYRDGVLEAEFDHDAEGRLIRLRQHTAAGRSTLDYDYDPAGRLISIRGERDSSFTYDQRGNLIERRDPSGRSTFRYSARGDLTFLSLPATNRTRGAGAKTPATKTFRFTHDQDGQILSVAGPDGETRLRYHPSGKLLETRFADGSAQTFGYNDLGMRLTRRYDDGGEVEYEYSSAGSILEVRVANPLGLRGGQTQILDQNQRVTAVHDSTGQKAEITYDSVGNVKMLRQADGATLFRYDALDRLSEVVTPEGRWLSYTYDKGEADLRIQADRKTRGISSPRVSSGLTFAPANEVIYSRTSRSDFGAVTLDSALAEYRLTTEQGPVLPGAVPLQALDRARLLEAKPRGERSFAEPSNVLFVPAEYVSLNCCIPLPWCVTCDPDPQSRCYVDPGGGGDGGDDGGGSNQTNFADCCAFECSKCQTTRSTDRNNALILYIAAEGACQAGVCATAGQTSARCIACQATALTLFLVRLDTADSNCGTCAGARTATCRARVPGSSALTCASCSC